MLAYCKMQVAGAVTRNPLFSSIAHALSYHIMEWLMMPFSQTRSCFFPFSPISAYKKAAFQHSFIHLPTNSIKILKSYPKFPNIPSLQHKMSRTRPSAMLTDPNVCSIHPTTYPEYSIVAARHLFGSPSPVKHRV